MIGTGIDARVQIQQLIENQLPEFLLTENPKASDFLKQYYISQEFKSGVVDVAENLDQYLDLDNLTPEVISDNVTLSVGIGTQDVGIVTVSSTKGYPNQYGLLKIDDEIITYTGLTTNTFTGLTRGFSGITSYHQDLNDEELVFTTSNTGVHTAGSSIQNLSSLFLKEFYNKFKNTFAPGFENLNFNKNLNVGNFLKEIKSFYETKGTNDAIKILFRVLYGVDPKIINLEDLLLKPSSAEYLRRETVIVEVLSGNPIGLVGQTIKKIEKLNDPQTQASVSEVEPFTRQGRQYFKFSLFIGYSDASLIEGNFKITPSSKSVEKISIGSSIITVDSTVGFNTSGKVLSGINTISYSDKTINQFLGCTGITSSILPASSVHSDEIYFGYEDGDLTKKVEFRITGIISKFKQTSDNVIVSEGDVMSVKNLGIKVKNPTNKNRKEVFANSWIYNTSSFYKINNVNSSIITFNSEIDRSSLKVGDFIEIVDRNNPSVVIYPTPTDSQPYVSLINNDLSVTVDNLDTSSWYNSNVKYNLRRKLNKARSINVPLSYDLTSDVSNVYFDQDNGYVASNSLPSGINANLPLAPFTENIDFELNQVTLATNGLQDLNNATGKYKTLKVSQPAADIKLLTGDRIFYESSGDTFNKDAVNAGIDTGSYFIEVVSKADQLIKLYSARSFIQSGTSLELDYPKDADGNAIPATHTFTLYSQRSKTIQPKKSLKKFVLNTNLKNGSNDKTISGTIGKLINGVEIYNYKTNDKIYFGPISRVNLLSGGDGYDVINPPKIEVSAGLGTQALIQASVKGKIVDAFIDKQDFDIDRVISIGVTGGNGSGAVLEPIIGKRSREIFFDATAFTSAKQTGIGNADGDLTLLTFKNRHNLNSGDRVIYNSNNQVSVGQTAGTFVSNQEYFVSVVNDKSIRFFQSQNQAFGAVSAKNAVGLIHTAGGQQRIIVGEVNNTILGVNVLSGGQGYENKKLFVQPVGISTIFDIITFENHNFKDGDKIVYEHPVGTASTIVGLSTVPNQQYIVSKIDDNSFKLSDAGIGGTSLSNFNENKFVNLETAGIGTQTFKYPDIVATIDYVGLKTATNLTSGDKVSAVITPVVRGEISNVYLHEKGTGYGSTILNFENNPIITIKNGSTGVVPELKAVVNSNTGGISTISIGNTGSGYFSTPNVEIVDSLGIGNGAKLRVIMNKNNEDDLTGSIKSVEIVSAGIGYSESTTSIRITPAGVGGVISANVRILNVNNNRKYGDSFSRLEENGEILQNVVCGYSTIPFNDSGTVSNIIGWAYDGNPIYGPYGYADPEKKTTDSKLLVSGYEVDTNSVIDRPSIFPAGFFIEDHVFKDGGDLDEFNGRFEINDDYPNGVYVYHATINSSNIPTFPYFIGDKFRSKVINDNFKLDQSFDFFNSSLRRNTLPYNVSDSTAGNDFITEANEIQTQKIEIETVESGSVNELQILQSGSNQRIGDVLNFNNTGTGGDGLIAKVSSIKGEFISSIKSDTLKYNDAVISKEDNEILRITPVNNHNLRNNDLVTISGLSSSFSNINGSYIIGVSSLTSSNISTIAAGSATTEIYVSNIPSSVKVGNKIGIGTETMTILNLYDEPNILTVERGLVGLSHSVSTPLYVIPDSFTIQKSVDSINSRVNQKVFFNPTKSVGFGDTAGGSITKSFSFGNTRTTRVIPNQAIYLENHPFVTNQKLKLTNATGANSIGISTLSGSTITAMPSTVFAVRKNRNLIGIKTGIGTDPTLTDNKEYSEVFFRSIIGGGGDDDRYFFESDFVQQKVNIKNVKNTVSLGSSFHQLRDNDEISLIIKSNHSVGIGTSHIVRVRRDSSDGYINVDPVQCQTSGITTVGVQTGANTITIENHNLSTGQKVKHFATTSHIGIGNSNYFVSVIDDNKFKLCESLENATVNPPVTVGIVSVSTTNTTHTFTKINPPIVIEKNNNLVFDTSDTSLTGFKFKLYYDTGFKNEFVSTGSSTGFNIPVGIITEGLTGSRYVIGFGNSVPDKLYYNLERLGIAITADNTIKNYSEIEFVDNNLSGKFTISNVGVSTFTFDSVKQPQRSLYTSLDCDELSYSTTSGIVTGAIKSINIVSGGSNYRKLPSFVSVGSTTVNDVSILTKSKSIGNIKKTRIINEGFEYSSDPTLQPEALIPSFVQLRGSKRISSVEIISGGGNYLTAPNLVVVDTDAGTTFSNSALDAILSGSSVGEIQIDQSPTGITVGNVALIATNNTNGVSIQKVGSTAGTSNFDIFITTPALGYVTNPFKIGDSVFIEGLQKVGTAGSGFNSSDYGYKLLRVSNYDDSGTLDKVTIDVSQYTTNTGVAVTSVSSFGSIINSNVYPSFKLNLVEEGFTIGEKISINDIERDLTVVGAGENFVKLIGLYEFKEGDIITGIISRNEGKVENIFKNEGQFSVNYSLIKDLGWETNTGKLNDDIQVLPNNDYYQNLSYTIQSPITWNDLKSPVNNLVHTAGFKNFSDTGITSTSNAFPITGSANISLFLDILPSFVEKTRVDTLYNFDTARDIFVGTGATDLDINRSTSKFIQLQNVSLTDFIQAKTNNVLNIDDISSRYSNLESDPNLFLDILQTQSVDGLNRILLQIKDLRNTQKQIVELILLNNDTGSYLLEKNKLDTENADFTKFELINESGKDFLRFTPIDLFKFDVDYDIKTIESKFNSTLTGTGSSTFGFASVTGSVVGLGSTTDVSGITSSIVSISSVTDSLYINSQVTDLVTNEMNYVETLLGHDGRDTFMSQAFFDTNQGTQSSNFIGSFGASLSSGILSFEITNKEPNPIRVRSSIVGFGSTPAGIGTYRFLASGQEDGSERTQLVESKFDEQSGTSTIATLNKSLFSGLKATVHVGTATSEALHQVYVIHKDTEIFTNQSEFLSIGSTIGIGTFNARFVSDNFVLEFIPDNTSGITTVRSLNEVFYADSDEKSQFGAVNNPVPKVFGKLTQTSDINFYNALNGDRINRRNFELTSNNTPIFAKTFDPSNTSIVNLGTGKFSIDDHFFRTQEELIYTPQASFVGVGSTPMMYKPSSGNIDTLPTTVFAIRENDNVFSISTTRTGTAVTFMDVGEGNNHQFEMAKGLTKALVTIDGLVQHPIAQTELVYQVSGNGGSIGTASTIFSMSGISTINIENILKIDDEFIRITNVGFGTTNVGPVSGTGTIPLIQGQRGYVGSSATNHSDLTNANIFKGSYNISGKEIYFTEAPRGNSSINLDSSNLPPARSDFEGRVYLRNNYDTNILYDNISNQFTGVGQTFSLTTGGIATSGIGSTGGNGILFVNNIFQRPTTTNNSNGNFTISDTGTATTVRFSGITTIADGSIIIDESDVNQNELPRGGVIVSLGSTGGLGYAPLVGTNVKPQTTLAGTISTIVGVAYSGVQNGIVTASYDNTTGLLDITTVNKHDLRIGYTDEVLLSRLEFKCAAPHAGVTTTFFPDGSIGDKFSVVGITSDKMFTTQVGTSTIPHTYHAGGIVRNWYGDLTFGSGYTLGTLDTGNTVFGVAGIALTVFDPGYKHVFASAVTNAVSVTGGASGPFTPSDASYDPVTGDLVLFINGHGLTGSNTVTIATGSISFTCSKDNFATNHAYPRATDPAAGATLNITSFNTNSITVNVGANVGSGATVIGSVGAGGTVIFNLVNGGSNYKEPEIFTPSPSYDNMPVVGVSRLATGQTTETGVGALISADVNISGVDVGIGSTLFSVKNFRLSRNGYSFRKGDKFAPVGLVTEKNLPKPISDFILEVAEVYEDNFASWQFGELDYVDSIKNLQDGSRTKFPIFYNGELLSVQIDPTSDIIAQNLLLIFVNGVNQKPGVNYQFDGGTTFTFTTAPTQNDEVAIYIYKGTNGDDSIINTDINKTLEEGDNVQLMKFNGISTSVQQDERTAIELTLKDRFETNLYTGEGIDADNFRPMHLYKQKVDKIIGSRVIPKTRDSIEPQIYPTAKVISDITSSSTNIFVDNANFFNYEAETSPEFNIQIISNTPLPLIGITTITSTISAGGTVSGLTIVGGGSGYTSAPSISISAPRTSIGVGVGTTATATVSITNGVIDGFAITNPGLGYTVAPSVLVQPPTTIIERTGGVGVVTGFSGIVTGISTVINSDSNSLALEFNLDRPAPGGFANYNGLVSNTPILIKDTTIGTGVTSMNESGIHTYAIGSQFLDNIYVVSDISNAGAAGSIICNIESNSVIPGIATVGTGASLGEFSFGKLSSINRGSTPISIGITGLTVDSGLSTFPSIQRSGGDYTLRKTGALPKTP